MTPTIENETIRPLPAELRQGGFTLKQIKRQSDVAIYAQCKGGKIEAYEVILIRVRPAHTFPNGIVSPTREAYPSNEDWGELAWTCSTLDRADERFIGLCSASRNKATGSEAANSESFHGQVGST